MSKEEAIEILSNMRCEYNLFGDEEEATKYHALSWAIKAMNADPTKHGRWIKIVHPWYECSECGERTAVVNLNGEVVWKYCPNCGARMDGGENG